MLCVSFALFYLFALHYFAFVKLSSKFVCSSSAFAAACCFSQAAAETQETYSDTEDSAAPLSFPSKKNVAGLNVAIEKQ